MIYWRTYIGGGPQTPLSLYCVFANIIIYLFNNLTVPDQTANKMNEKSPFKEQKKKTTTTTKRFVKSFSAIKTIVSYLINTFHTFFLLFLSNINCEEQLVTMQQTEKKQKCILF